MVTFIWTPAKPISPLDEVCERYGLTLEELASWQRGVERSGMQGLRVTKLQHYRDLYSRIQNY